MLVGGVGLGVRSVARRGRVGWGAVGMTPKQKNEVFDKCMPILSEHYITEVMQSCASSKGAVE